MAAKVLDSAVRLVRSAFCFGLAAGSIWIGLTSVDPWGQHLEMPILMAALSFALILTGFMVALPPDSSEDGEFVRIPQES